MGNHYHMVLQVDEEGRLSDGMEELNGRFARETNRRLGRKNHLFGERFKSWLIEDDEYLYEVTRYTLLNPVRAHLIQEPRRWKWSSLRATLGLPIRREERPRCLDVDWVLGHFCDDRATASFLFNRYVDEGIGRPRPVPPETC